MAQIENQEYKGARDTFSKGLDQCMGDTNLLTGLQKANTYLQVIESAGREVENGNDFDVNANSQRENHEDGDAESDLGDDKGIPIGNGVQDSDHNQDSAENESKGEAFRNAALSVDPWPGSSEEEIARIRNAPNHYAVLHVTSGASTAQMKKNYYTLARMLHPDRCQLEGAGDAMMTVSQAYDTLSNKLKKTLYDQFLSQTGGDSERPNQTYQEWESQQEPMELPKWLLFLLSIKGCGYFLFFIFVLVLLPVIIVLLLIGIIFQFFYLIWLLILKIVSPERYDMMKEKRERKLAKWEEEEQDRMFAHV